ncbi:hypothetical protein [Actinomadura parmotrematis]|nr:hypothetical protein [Actinomadura parmotrematis]
MLFETGPLVVVDDAERFGVGVEVVDGEQVGPPLAGPRREES